MNYSKYLIKKDDKFHVAIVKGFIPKNSEGPVPNSIQPEDYPYLKSREIQRPDFEGQTIKEIYIDEDAKSVGQSEATQAMRNNKLQKLRSIRDKKLLECDNIVRDLALGLRSDQIPIREYRDALKSITDDYKYMNDANKGKAALDFFADDMSDFSWPAKP